MLTSSRSWGYWLPGLWQGQRIKANYRRALALTYRVGLGRRVLKWKGKP